MHYSNASSQLTCYGRMQISMVKWLPEVNVTYVTLLQLIDLFPQLKKNTD